MQGVILLSDECAPMDGIVESPINGQHDIHENQVLTVRFRDPSYGDDYIFPARRLPGAIDPPVVLAPEKRDRDNYRPAIGELMDHLLFLIFVSYTFSYYKGFNRDLPQASLGDAGHRMLNHHSGNNQQREYSSNNFNGKSFFII